jgi:omega-6 fatty acid desaturase (delta-12 desaturase)
LSFITFTPYTYWRRTHAMHHACSGDLDRRGKSGEIFTLTVEEYRQAGWWQRLCYRIYRHPLVLFGVGPIVHFAICQRLTGKIPAAWKKERRSVHLTNAGLLLIALAMSWLVGPLTFLMVQIPIMVISASIGVWLFYMQHQYEAAYWKRGDDWDYVAAAMAGSSHYRLPGILRWFTGSIGLHHVHHLDARIPNYRLQQCHDDNPELQQVQEFTLWESLACAHWKLWDERQQKMVGFKSARVAPRDDVGKRAEEITAVREERATGAFSRL